MNEELDIYGFGSFFSEDTKYQDIDLLIIHKSAEYKSCQLAIWCKRMLISKIDKADITLLTKNEEYQHSFLMKSNALIIGKVCNASAEDDINLILKKIKQTEDIKFKQLCSDPI